MNMDTMIMNCTNGALTIKIGTIDLNHEVRITKFIEKNLRRSSRRHLWKYGYTFTYKIVDAISDTGVYCINYANDTKFCYKAQYSIGVLFDTDMASLQKNKKYPMYERV